MGVGASYWKFRFSRWGKALGASEGYTVLMPVPGDLPVFLDLALEVCGRQSARNRVETLVIPDIRTPAIDNAVAKATPSWKGPLRIVDMPSPERWFLPRLRDPGKNHGVQLIAGIGQTMSTHVVLHDADLFLLRPEAHDEQYEDAVARDLDVLGISPPWDAWYAEHGHNMAATWEMLAKTGWLRSFRPYRHIGHDANLYGEQHTFDTTFWAQAHTDNSRIAVENPGDAVVHFNYVISSYRHFQRQGAGYHDANFRLLLIRLFIDLFDRGNVDYGLPTLETLGAGAGRTDVDVRYEIDDRDRYHDFRQKIDSVIAGPWSSGQTKTKLFEALRAFDAFYGFSYA